MGKQVYFRALIGVVFLAAAGFLYLQTGSGSAEKSQPVQTASISSAGTVWETGTSGQEQQPSGECAVYVCGAVKNPGVYRFPEGARVCDAVAAAGGLTRKAAAEAINQASVLTDGEQITIPKKSKKTKRSAGTVSGQAADPSGLVNINEADMAGLMTLSGIGEAKARLIIEYRDANGRFERPEDIMKISGIKDGVYRQIKDQITV